MDEGTAVVPQKSIIRVDLVVVNMVPPMFRITTSSCLAISSLTFKDSLCVGTYGVEDGRS